MVLTGSCFCGTIQFTIKADPVAAFRCHCLDCRKISGSTNSTNLIVPVPLFSTTSGNLKMFSKTGPSGSSATNFFCGDCGVTIYRHGPATPDVYYVKSGTLDDEGALKGLCKPQMELFAKRRIPWVPLIDGAEVKQELLK
ncbi:DUF636 domain protein [Colletotrichum truncatum]|uniref:DUF636 domain protein n=1 Tax=Colletotrichum truncatum TaxID=5467 RepID=A0ACC3YQB3_COLTU|nr:duf636 domain protein [Colletotrichum truncatum]KAF6796691.1 duf636 domain protein [Colletotrichum truncatum]